MLNKQNTLITEWPNCPITFFPHAQLNKFSTKLLHDQITTWPNFLFILILLSNDHITQIPSLSILNKNNVAFSWISSITEWPNYLITFFPHSQQNKFSDFFLSNISLYRIKFKSKITKLPELPQITRITMQILPLS